ncbi:MAG TPA: hypothetical protein VFA68_19190 [Terriglobales bacterium]|nr:hypothetical protein [Terriglobales bacterium]
MPDTNYVRIKDEAGIGGARVGAAMITVGKVLLIVDLLLLMFVYTGIRSGSHMWLWWVVAQGSLGAMLIAVGVRRRARGIAQSSRKS